jgi:mono/diheme cytochrome c family protein
MLLKFLSISIARPKFIIFGLFCLAVFGEGGIKKVSAEESSASAARGYELVRKHCAHCHAIERSGASPDRKAPPFRMLGRRYSLESLEEAFAEGIMVGHSRMPNFEFDSEEVGALIAYLKSIQ